MGLFRKKRPLLSRDEALACVPVKSEAVAAYRTDAGVMRLRYPLVVKPWIADLAKRFGAAPDAPPARQLELDELGTLTWALIDGKRSVRGIVKQFAGQTRVHPKEAEAAVTRFLRELGRRGIIGMAPAGRNITKEVGSTG
jgi:hypothetical protein